MLKMAEFAPMPKARVRMAIKANPRDLTNWRMAWCRSRAKFSSGCMGTAPRAGGDAAATGDGPWDLIAGFREQTDPIPR